MKFIRFITFATIFALIICASHQSKANNDVLYQTSTINALLQRVFDGNLTFGELKKHGNFGLGTFNGLNGEMIALDNVFYQIKEDGKVYPVNDATKTPFAVVTFFEADKTFELKNPMPLNELQKHIDNLLPTKNIFHAIKIQGSFKYLKARSVPKQQKPYPAITEIIKTQPIFEFNNAKGTMVGFRTPEYANGINVPGYHFHFLTDDKKAGGHVLECHITNGHVEIDYTSDSYMSLPNNADFYSADLSSEKRVDINKVEK